MENVFASTAIKEKIKQTNLIKYGYENPMCSIPIQEKAKQTTIEKYGVENSMFSSEFVEKWQKSAWSRKEYRWKTGEISLVQGNEPIVLKELEEDGYRFNDVFTEVSYMPVILYEFEGKQKRYYPDIFIPKENRIIEVKSEYTLHKEWDKNQTKFNATKELGFDFKLEIR